MANGMGTLYIASSGIRNSQNALNTTANNLANVDTDGYVRQQVYFTDKEYNTFANAAVSRQQAGLGLEIGDVIHARDIFLDKSYRTESGRQAFYETSFNAIDEVQTYFQEMEGQAFQNSLSDLYTAFEEFAKDPSDSGNQNLVIQKASLFISRSQAVYSGLKTYQSNINKQISDDIDKINELGNKIHQLNFQIRKIEAGKMETAMSLRDERDLLIDSLAEFGDIEVTEKTYGKLINGSDDVRITVKFAGTIMVEHGNYRELEISKRVDKKNVEDVEGLYDVGWKDGATLTLSSGKLKSTMELRDGNGSDDTGWVKGVPHYIEELNKIARNFAMAFNEGIVNGEKVSKGYADGYTFNSEENATQPAGLRFFCTNERYSNEFANGWQTNDDIINGYQELNAGNISLSKETLDDIGNLFKSFDSPLNNNDTESIKSLLDFKENSKLFGTSNLEDYVSGMITNLGVDADVSKKLYKSHQSIMTQLENQRDAYSGVSLDEEATNLVRYQQMYKAAAKVMSTFSEIYEVLVNTI